MSTIKAAQKASGEPLNLHVSVSLCRLDSARHREGSWLQDSSILGKCSYCLPTTVIHPLAPTQTPFCDCFLLLPFSGFPWHVLHPPTRGTRRSTASSRGWRPPTALFSVRFGAVISFTVLCSHHHYLKYFQLFSSPERKTLYWVRNNSPSRETFLFSL